MKILVCAGRSPKNSDCDRREVETVSVTQVKIALSGGPAELAMTHRSVDASVLEHTLKIRHGAGYEHFVHGGEFDSVDGCEIAVFRWSHRTKIAE